MNENNITKKDLIESYDKLTISDKRKELGREITEMSMIVQNILNNITSQKVFTDDNITEFYNLYNGTISEADYLTGLYEDIVNFKELFGIYLDITNKNNE